MAASLGQRTLVTFVLDVSSAMGPTHGERSRLDRSTAFVSLRVLEMVSIVTYGSERTNNIVRRNGVTEGYEGVDEVWPPSRPTLATLDVLNALRPARRETRCDPDVDTIKARLAQDAIQLRVMGFDFPADPTHTNKTDVPHSVAWFNVGFWRTMLQDLPHAAFASADDAEEQALLPNTQLAKSAPTSVQLTFGAPDGDPQRTLSIPVQVLKATAVQRPMSQRKVRKGLETPVDARRVYYKVDDVLHHEDNLDQLEPLPEESHASFQRAFKLGASLVPMQHAMEQPLDTQAGLEILHFVHASTYRREYHLGETSYVVPNPKSPRAHIALSSLVQAALVKDVYLLCRWVSRAHADPKLCVLAPLVEQEMDCFCMVRVPFREDVKRFAFPPLDRVPAKDGTEVRTHPTIPTDAQQADMDRLVDAMDLMDADPDGDPEGWYAPNLSFNPAIHGVKNAVKWRFLAPERADLPELHPVLAQFLSTPEQVEHRARSVREACAAAFAARKPQASAAGGASAPTTPNKKARTDSDSDATPDEDAEEAERTEIPVRGGGVLRLAHIVQDFEASVYGTERITETCEAMQVALQALLEEAVPFLARFKKHLLAFCPSLWNDALRGRLELGLITHTEDAAHRSEVDAAQAAAFVDASTSP
ncbi:hypothetical protein CBS9595_002389 [Malassezia furfur]|nr:hypothetical protein CBS9595_002389 [Malassezia furfur]